MKPTREAESLQRKASGYLCSQFQMEFPAPEIVPQFGRMRTPQAWTLQLQTPRRKAAEGWAAALRSSPNERVGFYANLA